MALITLGANSGKGKVLQVSDMVIITSEQTLVTNTFTDITGATLNITPTSTSSKILLIANFNLKHNVNSSGFGVKILRDSTNIFESLQGYHILSETAGNRTQSTFMFEDSPASTSQKTYKFQASSWSSREIRFQNSGQSTYQAMEIQG
jgi:hypothetical protein